MFPCLFFCCIKNKIKTHHAASVIKKNGTRNNSIIFLGLSKQAFARYNFAHFLSLATVCSLFFIAFFCGFFLKIAPLLISTCADPEGVTGGQNPHEKSQNFVLLSNTGTDAI